MIQQGLRYLGHLNVVILYIIFLGKCFAML